MLFGFIVHLTAYIMGFAHPKIPAMAWVSFVVTAHRSAAGFGHVFMRAFGLFGFILQGHRRSFMFLELVV